MNKKLYDIYPALCFDEILIPAPSPATFTQFVHALMEHDFGELAM
jgi:hypothetical protein